MPNILTRLPLRPDKRIDWKVFFSGVKPGDTFILSSRLARSIATSSRMNGVSTRQSDNGDGTFTLSIVEPYQRERDQILAAFANLNHSQLKAIYQAGEKAGLFA